MACGGSAWCLNTMACIQYLQLQVYVLQCLGLRSTWWRFSMALRHSIYCCIWREHTGLCCSVYVVHGVITMACTSLSTQYTEVKNVSVTQRSVPLCLYSGPLQGRTWQKWQISACFQLAHEDLSILHACLPAKISFPPPSIFFLPKAE